MGLLSSLQGSSENPGPNEISTLTLGDRFRPSAENGDLTIVNVQLEDEGYYWCEAFTRAGSVFAKAFFDVQSE